jgi:hypothetical protein
MIDFRNIETTKSPGVCLKLYAPSVYEGMRRISVESLGVVERNRGCVLSRFKDPYSEFSD